MEHDNNDFDLFIAVNGVETSVKVTLMPYGYTHRFTMEINGIEVIYEPDEERNYRVIVSAAESHKLSDTDKTIIQLVAQKLQEI